MRYTKNHESGFSLIEVAIAMTVLSLLLLPALKIYELEIVRAQTESERAVIETAKAALQKYALENNVYPLPANPTIAYGAANYGKAVAGIAGLPVCNPANPATTNGACVICEVGQPVTKTNCAHGGRPFVAGAYIDNRIVIGALPFTEIGLSPKQASDLQNNVLLYAVTYKLTQPKTGATPEPGFQNDHGAIFVNQEDPNAQGVYDPIPADSGAHFIVLSSGQDAKNAFNVYSGIRSPTNCGAGGADDENCNYNGLFVNNFFYGFVTGQAAHYDDFIGSTATLTADLWSTQPAQPNIISRNFEGKIAIGYTQPNENTVIPKARMDIKGNVNANQIATTSLCRDRNDRSLPENSPSSFRCLQPQNIGGVISPPISDNSGIYCPGGKALTGIASANQVCGSLTLPTTTATELGNCTTVGHYPCGVALVDGVRKIQCGPPGWTGTQCVTQ